MRPLVDGVPAYRRIAEAVTTARHSIWLTVCFVAPDFEMPDGSGSLFDVLDRAVPRGLDVRVIFWRPNQESIGYGRTFSGSPAERNHAQGARLAFPHPLGPRAGTLLPASKELADRRRSAFRDCVHRRDQSDRESPGLAGSRRRRRTSRRLCRDRRDPPPPTCITILSSDGTKRANARPWTAPGATTATMTCCFRRACPTSAAAAWCKFSAWSMRTAIAMAIRLRAVLPTILRVENNPCLPSTCRRSTRRGARSTSRIRQSRFQRWRPGSNRPSRAACRSWFWFRPIPEYCPHRPWPVTQARVGWSGGASSPSELYARRNCVPQRRGAPHRHLCPQQDHAGRRCVGDHRLMQSACVIAFRPYRDERLGLGSGGGPRVAPRIAGRTSRAGHDCNG